MIAVLSNNIFKINNFATTHQLGAETKLINQAVDNSLQRRLQSKYAIGPLCHVLPIRTSEFSLARALSQPIIIHNNLL